MEAVKEKLIEAIKLISIEEAISLWEYVTNTHVPCTSLASLEEVAPTAEELQILDSYENGDEPYQPYISHEDLKKELGLV